MSVRQTLEDPPRSESLRPGVAPRRVRPEDVLRGLLISAIVLVVGIFLGNFTKNEILGRGTPYYVLAASLGVVLTAVAYYKIETVMVLFLAVVWIAVGSSPSVATGVSSGTGKSVGLSQIGMSFLIFIWLLRAAVRRQLPISRLPINGLLVLYLAFNILSVINGAIFWDPLVATFWGPPTGGRTPLVVNVFELLVRFLSAGAFWLFANNLRDAAWVRRASWLLLLPGLIVLLIHFVPVHLPLNPYSVLLEIVLACTLFAWLIEPRTAGVSAQRGLRFWGWLVLGVLVFQMFRMNINWVSGWFGLFVALYFVAFLRSRRLFVGLALGGLLLYVVGHGFLQTMVVHKIQTSGDTARFSMARGALLFALKFPLGIGPGNYRSYNIYYGRPVVWNTGYFPFSHSFYSQTLSELGFGGLILTILFILAGVIMVSRFYHQMPLGTPRTFVLGIAGMWVGISAASGIGDYLIPVYYNAAVITLATTLYTWMGLGIAVANARLYGLVVDEKPHHVAPPSVDVSEYYPRRMGREPAPPMPAPDSYYPRRMGRDRDSV